MAFRLMFSRGQQLAYRTAFIPRFLPTAQAGVAGFAQAAQEIPVQAASRTTKRTFLSGLIKKWQERLQQDPEYKKSVEEWEKHLEENPDLKVKIDKAKDTTQKTATVVAQGAKVAASAVGTAAEKLGEGASKVGQIVRDSAAVDAVSKATSAVSQSTVGQAVGRVVDATVRDITREGTVYPMRSQLSSPAQSTATGDAVPNADAATAAAPADAATAAAGETPAAAAAPAADAATADAATAGTAADATASADAAAAAGTEGAAAAAPGAEEPYRNAQAVTTKVRTVWERAYDRIKEFENSSNPFLRATHGVTNILVNLSGKLGGLVSETELAVLVREARDRDPTFTPELFVRYVRSVVPGLQKAFVLGDLNLIREYTAGVALQEMTTNITERALLGYTLDARTLDLDHIEFISGKVMDEHLVLMVTFVSQQYSCMRDKSGKIVQGSTDDIRSIYSLWSFAFMPTEKRWKVTEMATLANNPYL